MREQAQKIEILHKQKSLSVEKDRPDDQCYVRNSSFLSRDIETQKAKETPPKVASPPIRVMSPPRKDMSPPKKEPSPPKSVVPQVKKEMSPPKKETLIQKGEAVVQKNVADPKKEVTSPPVSVLKLNRSDSKVNDNSVAAKLSKVDTPPKKEVTSPPISTFKSNRAEPKVEENSVPPKITKRESSLGKDGPAKTEKLSLVADNNGATDNGTIKAPLSKAEEDKAKADEKNGVGDKIKKFEKAAEDASSSSNTLGRVSRAGSVRGRTVRLGSDGKDDFPPPATPFKDNVHFDLGPDKPEHANYSVERQQSFPKNSSPNPTATKWQRSESHEDKVIQKPEPQKIIKPEFKPMASAVDATIRSPSLGTKVPDQFPSHGTAFRNVASPDQARANVHKFNDDVNTQINLKSCKLKNKEKYSVSKGSSYFTRGSEEIWLVKKKDIEEIEERVLDSFRRAGGNICMRSESMRPSSDGGQSVSFTHATMGRNKRQMYARSESLDPQWAGARAQTLKRQTSVACTCGHDKKTRAKSAGADTPRPRSRSHGDDNQGHVLDKYETLV